MIGGTLLLIVTILINKYDLWVPFVHIGAQATVGGTFFMIGHVFSAYNIKRFNTCEMFFSMVTLIIGSFFWPVSLADGSYVNFTNKVIVPYIFTAVLAVWSLYSLPWKIINGRLKVIFEFIGRNTLTILTWHFLCFKVVSFLLIIIFSLDIKHLGEFPILHDFAGKGWWIVYVFGGILLPLSFTYCWHISQMKYFKGKHIA